MASRGKILIVDDEANARAALSEILHDEGYQTETAADGFKALGKLEEFAPDGVRDDLERRGCREKGRGELPHEAPRVRSPRGGRRARDGEVASPSRDTPS